MIQLSDIHSLLNNATTIDEDSFDVRLEEIITLVDQEKFNEATNLITRVLNEGTVDIRLVIYLFYTHFISHGVACLKDIFPLIITMINDSWDKVSPANMRDRYLVTSLTWFLSSIGKKIKRSEKLFKEKKKDEFWNKSVQKLTQNDIEELIELTREFSHFLTHEIEQPSLNQYILFISKWLEGLKSLIDHPKTEEGEVPLPETSELTDSAETSPTPLPAPDSLTNSEPMTLLMRKLQAFQLLIDKKDFEKAALIADDISLTIKSFDPSLFFPKLFSRYFAQSASHMDELSQHWENKGSLKWEALYKLYQTDLDEFIQWS